MGTKHHSLVVLGPGQAISLDDATEMCNNSYSVKCVSTTGVVMRIEVKRWHERTKNQTETWDEIEKINKINTDKFTQSLVSKKKD